MKGARLTQVRHKATEHSRRPMRRAAPFVLRLCFSLFGALAALSAYFWFTTPLPAVDRASAVALSTHLLDRHGRLIAVIPNADGRRTRPVHLEQLPLALQQATIAVEDRTFYANPGIEPRAIVRAAWQNLRSGTIVEGGSTITQQVARSLLLPAESARSQTIERKLRELILALKLTRAESKARILTLYFTHISYTGAGNGVETAALHLFGKSARDLTLAETALLAGLPQAPSRYDPFTQPAAARQRQRQVLDAMVAQGYISSAQRTAALAAPLVLRTHAEPLPAPHFTVYALDAVAALLGPDAAARGGLTITTTLDLDLQSAAQASVTRQIALLGVQRPGEPQHRVRNGAALVLDPHDGAILAMVGSPDFRDSANAGEVNGVLALRQPGSAIKPLTYAAALERGWTPASLLFDVPTAFPTREGRPYRPENYDRVFHGPLLLREALATSSNVAAVSLLEQIGVPALLDLAHRLGIRSLGDPSTPHGLAVTLGGGEVTLLELTGAYAAFANAGVAVDPQAVLAISGPDGVLQYQRPPPSGAQALSPQVAYLISDILADRYARMRAFGARSVMDLDRAVAVKTGTTTDLRDNWMIGYTPDRVVGVWVGNADGAPMQAVSGLTGAGPIWHEVMLAAHRDRAPRPFPRSPNLVEETICTASGLLASPLCPATRREIFVAGHTPPRSDDTHEQVWIDRLRHCRLPAESPAAVAVVYHHVPAPAAAWAAAADVAQPPTAYCPEASPPIQPSAPTILSPQHGAVFRLSTQIARDHQGIELRATLDGPPLPLTFLVDDLPVAQIAAPPYRVVWPLRPGLHRIAVIAGAGSAAIRSADVLITVEEP